MIKYPFETFKNDNENNGSFYELLVNLRIEINYATNYFSDYKEFFDKVKELLNLIREDMLGNNPDYNTISFDNITFESSETQLPNIQNILNYVIRLKNSMILHQKDKNIQIFMPADLYHLVDSVNQSFKIITELNNLISKYTHGIIDQDQLKISLGRYIHKFLYEKHHIFDSLNSDFLK